MTPNFLSLHRHHLRRLSFVGSLMTILQSHPALGAEDENDDAYAEYDITPDSNSADENLAAVQTDVFRDFEATTTSEPDLAEPTTPAVSPPVLPVPPAPKVKAKVTVKPVPLAQ